jgi:hypothetical protein
MKTLIVKLILIQLFIATSQVLCAAVVGQEPLILQRGIGFKCDNRTFWSKVKLTEDHLRQANSILNKPITQFDTAAYLSYKTTGSRKESDDNQYARYKKLFPIVLAECVYNNGKYLPKIIELVESLLDQPAWPSTAADNSTGYQYFYGKQYYVELVSCNILFILLYL